MVTIQDVRAAADRIGAFIHRTPVFTSLHVNQLVGAELFFKCENFQKVGAFKARGASNAIQLLDNEARQRGVATHSSGNHAQALAYAAQRLGVSCTVIMPETSPPVKIQATQGYGATVVFCENTLAARESALRLFVERTGAVEIHPYDNNAVIAGQGTAALELHEQVPKLDVVVAPIGGGGLMSGTAITTRALRPQSELLGAEPELASDAKRSLETGVIQAPYPPVTIADGLRTALCARTFEYLRMHHVTVLTATEEQIRGAMTLMVTRMKLVVEPSGAVPLAAVVANPEFVKGKRVGIIVSGGNVDPSVFQANRG